MSEAAPSQLERGLQFHQTGDFAKAETIYRQLLADDPNHADALHLLGLLKYQSGHSDAGADLINKAVQLRPDQPIMLVHYGEVLRSCRRFEDSIQNLQRAIALDPTSQAAFYNLGVALIEIGNVEAAARAFEQVLQLNSSEVESRWQLISLLIRARNLPLALGHVRILNQLVPDRFEILQSMGVILNDLGQLPEAESTLRRAVALNPKLAIAHNDIGSICLKQLRIDEAIEAWKKAIDADPKFDWPYNNIAGVLKDVGNIDESILYFRKALEINPSMAVVRSNMLLSMHYSTSLTAEEIFSEHRQWQAVYQATSPTRLISYSNTRVLDRRLRIGYLSADFRSHSVADFLESVLRHHDHQRFEIVCYADVKQPDSVTERLKSYGSLWREVSSMSHEILSESIRRDEVDILVDLAGHSANNRMPVFAAKPAPIQVTWLGYPDTTGLDTIDYRITDALADPVGWNEPFYTEQLWRLPDCFLCYHPTPGTPWVNPLPADSNGYVTFASFNNFAKLNRQTIAWWAEILDRVPSARLLLKATVLSGEYAQRAMRSHFENVGMDIRRVELIGSEPDFFRHIQHYHRVDIGLDTFPYHGTTTTCEALWMGVPVVTLAGKPHASRVGVSLLNNVGMKDWVAEDPEQYIRLAVEHAGQLDRLRELRSGLRSRLEVSPLLDQSSFTQHLEAAFYEMWRRWVGIQGSDSP